jgi:serine/threonine protein kinase
MCLNRRTLDFRRGCRAPCRRCMMSVEHCFIWLQVGVVLVFCVSTSFTLVIFCHSHILPSCMKCTEMFCGNGYDGKKSDVWALGVILFQLLTNKHPFNSTNASELMALIKQGTYTLPSHTSPGIVCVYVRLIVFTRVYISLCCVFKFRFFQFVLPWTVKD